MAWLRSRVSEPPAATLPGPPSVDGVHAAPGLATLIDSLAPHANRTFLDLGPAADGNLRCYKPFARRVRFADLGTMWATEGSLADAVGALWVSGEEPYQVVLAWNVMDPLAPAQRADVVAGLADVAAPGARLHFMVDMADTPSVRRMRFTVVDRAHVHWKETGLPQPPLARLRPADIERIIHPFRVQHAFVLRDGMREYVAVRG